MHLKKNFNCESVFLAFKRKDPLHPVLTILCWIASAYKCTLETTKLRSVGLFHSPNKLIATKPFPQWTVYLHTYSFSVPSFSMASAAIYKQFSPWKHQLVKRKIGFSKVLKIFQLFTWTWNVFICTFQRSSII